MVVISKFARFLYLAGGMFKILVIEDNKDLRELFAILLKQNRFKFFTASTKEELLKELKEEKPDLILLDLDFAFIYDHIHNICREIMPHIKEFRTPIIFLSTNKKKLANCYEIVPDATIEKPFDIKVVMEKIRGVITRQRPQENNS